MTELARMSGTIAAFVLKLPIHAYRWSFKALFGFHCRHLPTCSEYALTAIDRNGAWRGLWLTVSRLWRCRPGGTWGYDPAPDISSEHHALAPWRYGRWTGRHLNDGCKGHHSPSDGGSEHRCSASADP
ncbi:MAG: membrane protein insertion efficiency factor YidD [Hyphomicrobiaceae bacterium]